MRLGINARHLANPEIRGFTRYTLCLLEHLTKIFEVELYLFTDSPIHSTFRSRFPFREICFQSRREILWEQWDLPRKIRENRIDIFHAPANRGLPYFKVCPQVLTLHDLVETMPEFHDRRNLKDRFRFLYSDLAALRSANFIVTVSEHSKRDICQHRKIPAHKIHVTYEACEERFFEKIDSQTKRMVREKYQLPEKFLLYLGGFDRKKNIENLIRGYSLTDFSMPPLILAGERKGEVKKLQTLTQELSFSHRIHFVGQVEDEELPAFYQCASAFIYPSFYEGFGLPVIEAMASGLPVLCSNRTSLPEVVGENALFFDPSDPRKIQEAIKLFFNSNSFLEKSEYSTQRARFFSWKRTAEKTMDIYHHLLSSKTSHNNASSYHTSTYHGGVK